MKNHILFLSPFVFASCDDGSSSGQVIVPEEGRGEAA